MFLIVKMCSEEAMIKIKLNPFQLILSGAGVLHEILNCLDIL